LVLVTYHPTNLEVADPALAFVELEAALAWHADSGGTVVFTMPNADNNSRDIRRRVRQFSDSRTNVYAFESLGTRRYFSLMRAAAVVIGNSSSGLYEAPLVGTPTVDIGNRQRGRERGGSVVAVDPNRDAIAAAIQRCLEGPIDFSGYPYGTGGAARQIHAILSEVELEFIVYKRFHDMGTGHVPE
jgi:UDP-N-acetylglucosamine 2-epimerase (non-hydrolysing)/GDP/UDP-N,N'-diacetylbacillosamine 2-epimerase (hydrolysing)